MNRNNVRLIALGATAAAAMFAQPGYQRQATMIGGGEPNRGKCTIEVVVDDVVQVEVRGANATLRTLSGQPGQWRRFQCTSPMPANPVNFRFAGVDGRGRQTLVRDPRNGGMAVVQIEDKDGGSEGYTFDLFWENGGQYGGPPPPPQQPQQQQPQYDRGGDRDRDRDSQYRPNYRDSDYYRRYNHGFGTDEAIRVCQQNVVAQASRRFRSDDIHFGRTALDDQPGRNDWVMGTLDVHRGGGREERFAFSCSVDFQTGRVRSAQIDPRPLDDDHRWR